MSHLNTLLDNEKQHQDLEQKSAELNGYSDIQSSQRAVLDGGKGHVTIVILGATGDLAKKKTFPALFHLFKNGLISKDVLFIGYGRTKLSRDAFHKHVYGIVKNEDEKWNEFISYLWYISGAYDSDRDFENLSKEIDRIAGTGIQHNRIYYMALPPNIFESTAVAVKNYGMSKTGWNRIIIEKPFGRNLESSNIMNDHLSSLFREEDIFRIDHYLGKEMIQNLMTLRFANAFFEFLWNQKFISNIKITFKEDFGTQGRAGYFDQFGIIRDVMQNHLLQILSLIALEPPASTMAEDVRNEKVKVLKSIPPLKLEDLVIGQYYRNGDIPGYLEESGVSADSITPTFATAVLYVENSRWKGVPFILKCGKGLNERKAEIRIQFKKTGCRLFPDSPPNELVFIIQPNEAIYLKMVSKVPGLKNDLIQSELDLTYKQRYNSPVIPDAYERLILDVFRGDRNLFVRADELESAWKIFTPILKELDEKRIKPYPYTFGTRGPSECEELETRHGWRHYGGYQWGPSL